MTALDFKQIPKAGETEQNKHKLKKSATIKSIEDNIEDNRLIICQLYNSEFQVVSFPCICSIHPQEIQKYVLTTMTAKGMS